MRVQKLAFLIGLGILSLSGFRGLAGIQEAERARQSFLELRKVYDDLLKATSFGKSLLYPDNLRGQIVWDEAWFMESLLNMYEATGELRYLEIFVDHADHVLKVRDDNAGRTDYAGRLRPGWQTGEYYTLGVPVIIPDERGRPSLEVQGVHFAGNNRTVIEIVREGGERFTLLVRNDFRRKEPLEVRFANLTLGTVEKIVNADLSPKHWVRVRVVGNSPPSQGIWALSQTYRMVLHELHTPGIGLPFLRFTDLVFRSPRLAVYRPRAEKYAHALQQSFHDYVDSWREDAEGGYFVFEPEGKFWASGLPIPYNGLSANGLFLLWLWRGTKNPDYLEKAAALARKVRTGITFLPDGTMTMPYWIKDSLPYTGWENRNTNPINGLYSRADPNRGAEDVSHFSRTLHFMFEAWKAGLIFQESDLQAVARTFTKRLWKPTPASSRELCDPDLGKGFYLAHNLEGRGKAYDYAIATFGLLSRWEPSLLQRGLEVFKARFKDAGCIRSYGIVMLGWSILSRLALKL